MWSAVVRAGSLEEAQHVLGTVGGPQREEAVVSVSERASTATVMSRGSRTSGRIMASTLGTRSGIMRP